MKRSQLRLGRHFRQVYSRTTAMIPSHVYQGVPPAQPMRTRNHGKYARRRRPSMSWTKSLYHSRMFKRRTLQESKNSKQRKPTLHRQGLGRRHHQRPSRAQAERWQVYRSGQKSKPPWRLQPLKRVRLNYVSSPYDHNHFYSRYRNYCYQKEYEQTPAHREIWGSWVIELHCHGARFSLQEHGHHRHRYSGCPWCWPRTA